MYWFFVIIVFLLAGIKTGKPKKYQKVSVIIPAYNEEDTVAKVIEVIKKVSFVDEVIVVNDGSSDNTESEALKAGAIVINHETNKGKGEALYTGYMNAECDIIAFIDADIYNLTSKKVEAMIKPILLGKADITKTKFSRASGRVTELTAKPLLNFFFPEISFEQPLSGQFAARKEILKRINFEKDYGVDVGIVIDADVLGISILEVDIGAIEHDMSPLSDLNIMANEVVRTIINRANKYGRVTMIDDIGYYIRMAIVGLSLVILGLFTIFFVKAVPLFIGVLVSIVGIILAIYYMIKVIVQSIGMFKKTPKGNLVKSFVKIHFPMIISIILLLLMISTFIGAAHYENGVLSIEPNSRNLVIYADDAHSDRSISVRGPYTVDAAIENESGEIRMPNEAMMTLGLKVNDTLRIGSEVYLVNETRPGEPDILRLPIDVKKEFDVQNGDVIQNSRLKDVFEGSVATHLNNDNENVTFAEKFTITSRYKNATTFEILSNGVSMANCTGILKDNTSYSIAVDDSTVETFTYYSGMDKVSLEGYGIEIVFKNEEGTSTNRFVQSSQDFLSFYF
ncbi:glycosyltransferase [uncultured Methanobrevibacter sp.]|uniref:glycosyltransferase n=1 Tax=uncultured Methanobrevibacter sp. TaxID=253161 RepID=UPI00261F413F|nr:glycosyltransferase [uncultured Methanobrevibacter sp.]